MKLKGIVRGGEIENRVSGTAAFLQDEIDSHPQWGHP